MAAPKTADETSVFNRPKDLSIRRLEDGSIEATYDGTKIENIVGFQMAASEFGTIATLVFPVDKFEVVETEKYLRRVFGGAMETTEGGTVPGGN